MTALPGQPWPMVVVKAREKPEYSSLGGGSRPLQAPGIQKDSTDSHAGRLSQQGLLRIEDCEVAVVFPKLPVGSCTKALLDTLGGLECPLRVAAAGKSTVPQKEPHETLSPELEEMLAGINR